MYDIIIIIVLVRINENVDFIEYGFFVKLIEKLKSVIFVSVYLFYINVLWILLIGYF